MCREKKKEDLMSKIDLTCKNRLAKLQPSKKPLNMQKDNAIHDYEPNRTLIILIQTNPVYVSHTKADDITPVLLDEAPGSQSHL